MEGLEKIKEQIEESARILARETIEKAHAEAEDIWKQADYEEEKLCAEIDRCAQAERDAVRIQMESLAILQKRKMILSAKQEIMADIFEKARKYYKTLSQEEYFGLILSMVPRYALHRAGEMILSQNDIDRMPEHFAESLSQAVSGIEGAVLKIGQEPGAVAEGFILRYETVEINCSFDELISAAKDDIQDKLHALLFGME